jgi:hypothetical protein
VTFDQSFTSPCTYELAVNGTERTLAVEDDSGPETPGDTGGSDVPEPILVAVGLIAVAALVVAVSRGL